MVACAASVNPYADGSTCFPLAASGSGEPCHDQRVQCAHVFGLVAAHAFGKQAWQLRSAYDACLLLFAFAVALEQAVAALDQAQHQLAVQACLLGLQCMANLLPAMTHLQETDHPP